MTSPEDPAKAVARYAENTARLVPGIHHLQTMTALLLAERADDAARILVVGAGGGQELRAFAEAKPGWRFVGVDPSPEMLQMARAALGPLTARVRFHEGTVDGAPEGPFDGATCLLTLHFLSREVRHQTLAEIHRRLKPGAPLVVAHHSFPREPGAQTRWLKRYVAFAVSNGVPAAQAERAIEVIPERLPVLSPADDEAALRDAGFEGVELFYAGFTFRGWVGYKGSSSPG